MDKSRPLTVNPARPFSIRFPFLGLSRIINPNVVSGPAQPTAQDLEFYGLNASFQFARLCKEDGLLQAIARQQHYLFGGLDLKPGMVVLAIGCGVGTSVRELIQFVNVHVVGIDSNPAQVEAASLYAARAGVQDKVQFMQGTVMDLRTMFPERKFDAVYAMDGLLYRYSAEAYMQIYYVLKPAGRMAVYEWLTTANWKPDQQQHVSTINDICQLVGVASMPSHQSALRIFSCSEWKTLLIDDLATRNDSVPWYQPLQEYRRSPSKSLIPYASWFPFRGDCSTSTKRKVDSSILAMIATGETKVSLGRI